MINALQFLNKETSFKFIEKRAFAYIFSCSLIILSIAFVLMRGLNWGIDFSGGILIEVKSEEKVNLQNMRETLNALNLGEIGLQSIDNDEHEVMIRAQMSGDDEKAQTKALESIKTALGEGYEYRRVEIVGPRVGSELVKSGIWAVILSVVGISAYIWFRFEFPFAIAAMLSLVHDVIIIVGAFAITQLDFSLTTIAAILTVAGYSINDTVVNFDRVRENLKKHKKLPIIELLNLSVNDMLSRTILTSSTTMLTVLALLILGGETLMGFSFALMLGIFFGTFSSVYIAMPILLMFDLRKAAAPVGPYDRVDNHN
ncbi:MAG: protein translocase subunit SecF [Alphaproteobacteria bacterium]